MTPAEMRALSDGLVPVMRDYINKGVAEQMAALLAKNAALELRILELETRPTPTVNGPIGPQGERGERGEKGDAGPIGPQGERGLDGRSGIDGKDGAPGLNGKDGANGASGKDGSPGRDGIDGKDGAAGRDGLNGKDAPQVDIDVLVARVKDLIPVPKDGLDGAPGIVGKDGRDGIDGKDGIAGRDGRDGVPGIQGERGTDGTNGKDGLDGLGIDDADLLFDDQKGWTLRFSAGGRTKDFSVPLPWDAGVWEAGRTYPKGAAVTHDGNYWTARDKTVSEPGEGKNEWRLTVRRGKQGKEGKQGPKGDRGFDYTQLGTDGKKW